MATRHGSGILISGVLMALSVMGVSAITRTFFTSTQAQDCAAQVAGETCEALAQSAVAELEAQVREGLAVPDSAFTAAVHAPRPAAPGDVVDLTSLCKIPATEGLAATARFSSCKLEGWSCRLVDQRAIDEAPHERTAVIVLKCRAVSGPLGRRVARTVEQGHTLKIVLAGPPQPFGRFGFFLGQMGGLTDLAAVNAQRERLLRQLERVRGVLDQGAAAQTGEPRERTLDLLDDIPTLANATEHTPTVPTSTAGTLFYGLIPDGATLDTAGLDLARSLTETANRADPLLNALPAPAAADLAERTRPVAKAIEDGLWSIWANQEAFKILQPAAPEGYPFFFGSLAKLTPEYFSRRAHHRIVEPGVALPGRITSDPGKELAKLLAEGPLDAVIHVVSRAPIKLTGTIPGRVMLVIERAPVDLTDLTIGQGPLDRLTVAAFGGSVRVHGACQAYVIAGPATPVVLTPGSTLTGGLTMHDLSAGTRLEGTLVKSDRYDTGGYGAEPDPREVYTAALSPRVLYRRVAR